MAIHGEADARDPFEHSALRDVVPDVGRVLNADQSRALTRLQALADERRFGVTLLRGVTGSGKTEVYLRLAEHVRAGAGKRCSLCPEIALTPALAALARGAFGRPRRHPAQRALAW